eukprot:scaffold20132_cov48-Phaeocystis_antarctica.AAC.1
MERDRRQQVLDGEQRQQKDRLEQEELVRIRAARALAAEQGDAACVIQARRRGVEARENLDTRKLANSRSSQLEAEATARGEASAAPRNAAAILLQAHGRGLIARAELQVRRREMGLSCTSPRPDGKREKLRTPPARPPPEARPAPAPAAAETPERSGPTSRAVEDMKEEEEMRARPSPEDRIKERQAKEAKEKNPLKGFDIDEDSDLSVSDQLKEGLSKSSVRVIELFKEWDTDGNGKVSKKEFGKAMRLLGFNVPASDINALFDEWDPDGSGVLSMEELAKELKGQSKSQVAEAQAEAAKAGDRLKERAAKEAKDKMLLKGFDIDEDSDLSVADQLKEGLMKSGLRVIELFKEWDTDGDGIVSKEEFRKAMGLLGFSASTEDIDALFDSWDPDGSGMLSMDELAKELKVKRPSGPSAEQVAEQKAMADKVAARRKVAKDKKPPLTAAEAEAEAEKKKKQARLKETQWKKAKDKMLLKGFDVDEDSELSVADQLKEGLSKSSVRVIELFKEWDTDGDNKVSKKEFRKAMGLLGFSVPTKDIDALFDSWDPDGSGELTLAELAKELKQVKTTRIAKRQNPRTSKERLKTPGSRGSRRNSKESIAPAAMAVSAMGAFAAGGKARKASAEA